MNVGKTEFCLPSVARLVLVLEVQLKLVLLLLHIGCQVVDINYLEVIVDSIM